MKSTFSIYFIIIACFILGCGRNAAPPSATAQPATVQQPAAPPPVNTPTQQLLEPSPAISQPTSNTVPSAEKLKQSVEVFDLVNLLNRISTNQFALSDDGGWDKFTMAKVQRWANQNLVGLKGRIDVCILQCNVDQEDPDSKPDEWTVGLQVTGVHADYAGISNRILPIDKDDQTDHHPAFGTWGVASFTFKCNEADARKWDELSKKPVPAATVEGNIVGINFQPHFANSLNDSFTGYDTFVKMNNVVLKPSNDTEPGALYLPEYVMAQYGTLREPDQAITEIKRLDTDGDYQLIFIKYCEWIEQSDGPGHMPNVQKKVTTKLLSFPTEDVIQSIVDFGSKMISTPCDDPPTESQIAGAKASVNWPKK